MICGTLFWKVTNLKIDLKLLFLSIMSLISRSEIYISQNFPAYSSILIYHSLEELYLSTLRFLCLIDQSNSLIFLCFFWHPHISGLFFSLRLTFIFSYLGSFDWNLSLRLLYVQLIIMVQSDVYTFIINFNYLVIFFNTIRP